MFMIVLCSQLVKLNFYILCFVAEHISAFPQVKKGI